jgi:putative restriction endonuclease
MSVMTATAGSPGIDPGRPFTVDDLEAMPDDGRRYELIDGMLIVSPAPVLRHQKIVTKLAALLDARCPANLHTLAAPFAVQPSKTTELQPGRTGGARGGPDREAASGRLNGIGVQPPVYLA